MGRRPEVRTIPDEEVLLTPNDRADPWDLFSMCRFELAVDTAPSRTLPLYQWPKDLSVLEEQRKGWREDQRHGERRDVAGAPVKWQGKRGVQPWASGQCLDEEPRVSRQRP